ncbi:hypothetical protein RJ641_035776 [Dillenia turbinata]|uniref:Uncharacterized protein n=1 Tax=Dillenia turbinata TaxID=194707 RepID=A0AAN8VTP6_9MAGN
MEDSNFLRNFLSNSISAFNSMIWARATSSSESITGLKKIFSGWKVIGEVDPPNFSVKLFSSFRGTENSTTSSVKDSPRSSAELQATAVNVEVLEIKLLDQMQKVQKGNYIRGLAGKGILHLLNRIRQYTVIDKYLPQPLTTWLPNWFLLYQKKTSKERDHNSNSSSSFNCSAAASSSSSSTTKYGLPDNGEQDGTATNNINKQENLLPSKPTLGKRTRFIEHNLGSIRNNLKGYHNHQNLLLLILQIGFQERPTSPYQHDQAKQSNSLQETKYVEQDIPTMSTTSSFNIGFILSLTQQIQSFQYDDSKHEEMNCVNSQSLLIQQMNPNTRKNKSVLIGIDDAEGGVEIVFRIEAIEGVDEFDGVGVESAGDLRVFDLLEDMEPGVASAEEEADLGEIDVGAGDGE